MASIYIENQVMSSTLHKSERRNPYLVHDSELDQALVKLFGQVFTSVALL